LTGLQLSRQKRNEWQADGLEGKREDQLFPGAASKELPVHDYGTFEKIASHRHPKTADHLEQNPSHSTKINPQQHYHLRFFVKI
jgi:hypothetical protein